MRGVVLGAVLVLALFVVASARSPKASADHAGFWGFAFQQHFDHTNSVPGFPSGTVRALSVCNTLPNNALSTALREAVSSWNDTNTGAGFQAFWLFGPNELFGACPAQPIITARLGGPADCDNTGATACFAPTGLDSRGKVTLPQRLSLWHRVCDQDRANPLLVRLG